MTILDLLFVVCLAELCQASPDFQNSAARSVVLEDTSESTKQLGVSGRQHPTYYSKGITYLEFKLWNQRKRYFDKHVLKTRSIDFGHNPLRQRVPRFLKLQNPTDSPVIVQLFLLLDYKTVDEVLRRECLIQPSLTDVSLDEEEFDNVTHVVLPKCTVDEEEVPSVTLASAAPLPVFDHFTGDWSLRDKAMRALFSRDTGSIGDSARVNWLPKYKCGNDCTWMLSDPEHNFGMLESLTQAFFISPAAQPLQVIPAFSSIVVGPVYFQPNALGKHNATLIIRNNLTIVETVELTGTADFARLAFERETICRRTQHISATVRYTNLQEMSSLSFEVSKIDITSQQTLISGVRKLPEFVQFTRLYEARNVGNAPMTVTKMLLEGVSCSMMGFTVANCRGRTLLLPGETMNVNITYQSALLQNELQLKLWIVTETDAFYIPLELSIEMKDMSALTEQQGVNKKSWGYFGADFSLLLLVAIAAGYFTLLMKDGFGGTEKVVEEVTPRKELQISPVRVSIQNRCKSPVLVRPMETERLEIIRFPSPLPVQIPLETAQIEHPKTRKVKKQKQKNPVMKFAPGSNSPQPGMKTALPNVIATNKLLTKPVCKASGLDLISVQLEESDGEKPAHGSQDSCTTSHTEEEDDVYLDDYKTRLGLFGGFSNLG